MQFLTPRRTRRNAPSVRLTPGRNTVNEHRDYHDTLRTLSEASSTGLHFEAFKDIAWNSPEFAAPADDPRWTLPAVDPLSHTDWYRALSPQEQRRVARIRLASITKTGSQFEQLLLLGGTQFLMGLANENPEFRYFMHELTEETHHIQMFQEFTNRVAPEVHGAPTWLVKAFPLVGSLGSLWPSFFFQIILAGEEPIDHIQKSIMRGGGIHPLTDRIMQIHLAEEGHCHVVERGKLGECGVSTAMLSYKGHRYPVEIINHCVWLYFRFPLSFREVEEMMLERGVVVSYETIRRWCAKFGQAYANQLCRRRSRPGDKWHLDEVFIKINGTLPYLWRAVDQHGNVLDVLVQSRRNGNAAKRFFRKLLKGLQYVPRVIVTDKLTSYSVAHREMLASVEHRRSKYLNNRAENSHQPTRQREHAMKRFASARHAQRFLSAFSSISPHFRPGRYRLTAPEWRAEMADRFAVWQEVTAAGVAA